MKMWVIYKLTQDQTDELMLSKARPLLAKIKKPALPFTNLCQHETTRAHSKETANGMT